MRHLSVRARIIAGFAALIALIVGLGGFAELRLAGIRHEAEVLTTDALPGLYYTTEIESQAETHHLLVLMTHVASFDRQERLERVRQQRAKVEELIARHEATISDAEDRDLMAPLRSAWNSYTAATDAWLAAAAAGRDDERRQAAEREFARVQETLDRLVQFDKAHGDRAARQITASVTGAMQALWAGLAIALVLAIISAASITRAISRPLGEVVAAMETIRGGNLTRKLSAVRHDEFGVVADGFNRMTSDLTSLIGQVQHSGVQVGSSVAEIAATARQQQATANEVAATITEIGATSSEISATSRELAKTMKEVMESADATASVAASGQKFLGRMADTMRHIVDASGAINAKLAVLNDKAANIGTVVTTITKVADQTNLLSLNAAIEAEKAGEYGRGFAVVATEIRRLADQTAVATYDIEQMVKEIQSATAAGVMGMDKFSEEVRRGVEVVGQVGDQLTQIIHQVQALTPSFETVNDGMQSQAVGAQQISEALSQLNEGAQQTVESLRQSTAALEQLNITARDLQTGVARFTLAA